MRKKCRLFFRYVPIIPMVLVNGTDIDNESNSYVPNYNPRDIIANLKRLLYGEAVVPMVPWYKGFKVRQMLLLAQLLVLNLTIDY